MKEWILQGVHAEQVEEEKEVQKKAMCFGGQSAFLKWGRHGMADDSKIAPFRRACSIECMSWAWPVAPKRRK